MARCSTRVVDSATVSTWSATAARSTGGSIRSTEMQVGSCGTHGEIVELLLSQQLQMCERQTDVVHVVDATRRRRRHFRVRRLLLCHRFQRTFCNDKMIQLCVSSMARVAVISADQSRKTLLRTHRRPHAPLDRSVLTWPRAACRSSTGAFSGSALC